MEDCCAVCVEPMKWIAYGACGHREVCSTCTAMMRGVLNDNRCCICKQECDKVFITRELGKFTASIDDFDSLELRAQRNGYLYEKTVRAYFDNQEEFKRIKGLVKIQCNICQRSLDPILLPKGFVKPGFVFKNFQLLRQHVSGVHKLSMCELCLEGKKVFVSQQVLYTKSALEKHCSKGDASIGFKGHPLCHFCDKRFYGDQELYHHMSTEHYTCHFCQRDHPEKYEYYQSYDDLEAHFRNDHILCEDPECLAKKFIVFDDEAEFKIHNAKEHANTMTRAERSSVLRIPVSLQARRLDNAMVPVPAATTSQATATAPPPTAPRSDESSFPPLPGTAKRRPRRRKKANASATTTVAATATTDPPVPPDSDHNSAVPDAGSSSSPRAVSDAAPISAQTSVPISAQATGSGISLTPEEIRAATKLLFRQIRMNLNDDEDKIQEFRETHAEFKNDALSCLEYYDRIAELGLVDIIPKLAWLCPDRQKQLELYTVHTVRSGAAEPSSSRHFKGKEPDHERPEPVVAAVSKGKSKVGADSGSSAFASGSSSGWLCGECGLKNVVNSPGCAGCGGCRVRAAPRNGAPLGVVMQRSGYTTGGQPIRGAWKNNGGMRILQQAKQESVMYAAHARPGR